VAFQFGTSFNLTLCFDALCNRAATGKLNLEISVSSLSYNHPGLSGACNGQHVS
jgi:hypothetical protein